jgi:hypothetical protein
MRSRTPVSVFFGSEKPRVEANLVFFFVSPTLQEIKLQLARKEQERERLSSVAQDAAADTMTRYLMLGLELEGQQCAYISFVLFVY